MIRVAGSNMILLMFVMVHGLTILLADFDIVVLVRVLVVVIRISNEWTCSSVPLTS